MLEQVPDFTQPEATAMACDVLASTAAALGKALKRVENPWAGEFNVWAGQLAIRARELRAAVAEDSAPQPASAQAPAPRG